MASFSVTWWANRGKWEKKEINREGMQSSSSLSAQSTSVMPRLPTKAKQTWPEAPLEFCGPHDEASVKVVWCQSLLNCFRTSDQCTLTTHPWRPFSPQQEKHQSLNRARMKTLEVWTSAFSWPRAGECQFPSLTKWLYQTTAVLCLRLMRWTFCTKRENKNIYCANYWALEMQSCCSRIWRFWFNSSYNLLCSVS